MLCVATIGIQRACRAREKNFSSPDGSFSPVVAKDWYSSQTNDDGAPWARRLCLHRGHPVQHRALKVLLQHRAQRTREAGIHGDSGN